MLLQSEHVTLFVRSLLDWTGPHRRITAAHVRTVAKCVTAYHTPHTLVSLS